MPVRVKLYPSFRAQPHKRGNRHPTAHNSILKSKEMKEKKPRKLLNAYAVRKSNTVIVIPIVLAVVKITQPSYACFPMINSLSVYSVEEITRLVIKVARGTRSIFHDQWEL